MRLRSKNGSFSTFKIYKERLRSFSAFITFSASVPDLFKSSKVFFRLTYFLRRLVKAFFAASPVSKLISFATASQVFFILFYYEMLIPLYHINMGIFVLRLLVVPHLLFPFFKYCFSSFLTKLLTSNKMQLKMILFLLLAGRNFSGNKL